jgi:hypothetical protein
MDKNDSSSSSEAGDEGSSDIIINTKIVQPTLEEEPKASTHIVGDEVGGELMHLYLESESFPCEMPDTYAEALLTSIRYRRWYNDTEKLLGQLTNPKTAIGLSNNAKVQLKKQLKRQLRYDEAQLEEDCNEQDLTVMKDQCSKIRQAIQVLTTGGPLPLTFAKPTDNFET